MRHACTPFRQPCMRDQSGSLSRAEAATRALNAPCARSSLCLQGFAGERLELHANLQLTGPLPVVLRMHGHLPQQPPRPRHPQCSTAARRVGLHRRCRAHAGNQTAIQMPVPPTGGGRCRAAQRALVFRCTQQQPKCWPLVCTVLPSRSKRSKPHGSKAFEVRGRSKPHRPQAVS